MFEASGQELPGDLKTGANELRDIGSFVSFSTAAILDPYSKIISLLVSVLLLLSQFFLFLGMVASIIGYIGCFSLIQASRNNRGPLIWLGTEAVLCIIRLIIWASNPGWHGPPPPIALHKVLHNENSGRGGTEGYNVVTYDVSWTLDDVTADDMHALIIGIGEFASLEIPSDCARQDAQRMFSYIKDDLAVPEHQITLLVDSAAKGSDITNALDKLSTNDSVRQGAPILIYIAGHAGKVELDSNDAVSDLKAVGTRSSLQNYSSARQTPSQDPPKFDVHLATYDYDLKKSKGLSYGKILDLIQTISTRKGNNIVSHCRVYQTFRF